MGTTSTYAFPYPANTDAVAQGYLNIQQLAEAVENVLTGGGLNGSYRNLLDNGAMVVAQRGNSATAITATGYYSADRWKTVVSGTFGTWTQTIQSPAPGQFDDFLSMQCTTATASPAAGAFCRISQYLEGQDLQHILKGSASARTLTLSFWVKCSVTGTYIASLIDTVNARSVSASYSVAVANTWERKTITFPADTTGTLAASSATALELTFWLGAGSTYTSGTLNTTWQSTVAANQAVGTSNVASAINRTWQVSGVQLELGSKATTYETRPYGVELRNCARNYQRLAAGTTDTAVVSGFFTGTTQFVGALTYQTMRIQPTFGSSAASTFEVLVNGATTIVPSALTSSQRGLASAQIVATLAGATGGQGAVLRTDTGYIELSADH
jgi:hypothetical protein